MQQQINNLKDKLRAGVEVGKWRTRVLKLGLDRSSSEKERKKAVATFGVTAWEQRVEHPDYAEVFAQLVNLAQQRSAVQTEISALESAIQQAETEKQQLEANFTSRLHSVEQRKLAATAKLPKPEPSSQNQSSRTTKQLVIDETPATDTTATTTPLDTDIEEIRTEISRCEQEITAIKAEQQQALSQANAKLSQLRQELKDKRGQLASLERQFPALQQNLGEQVDRVRPESPHLADHYTRLNTLDQDIARLSSEIDTLNQQIAGADKGATQTLYLLVGGTSVALLLLGLFLFNSLGGFSGGGVSERQIRSDIAKLDIYWNIANVVASSSSLTGELEWDVQANQISKLKIVNRKTNLESGVDIISAQAELRNDVMTVSMDLEFLYRKYEQGWVLDRDISLDNELTVVNVRDKPTITRVEQDVRDGHKNDREWNGWCPAHRMKDITIEGIYGGMDSGKPSLVYYVTSNYNAVPQAQPGQLQAPDLCSHGEDWVIKYQWNGSRWSLVRVAGW